MDRAALTNAVLEWIERIEHRHGDDIQIRIAFCVAEVDDGNAMDYVYCFAGEDRAYVQDAFLEHVVDVIDDRVPILKDDDDDD